MNGARQVCLPTPGAGRYRGFACFTRPAFRHGCGYRITLAWGRGKTDLSKGETSETVSDRAGGLSAFRRRDGMGCLKNTAGGMPENHPCRLNVRGPNRRLHI